MSPAHLEFVVLGGGVTGLTTALELKQRFPESSITVVAKHFPGSFSATEYASSWAGANWISFENSFNRFAEYDRVAFNKFTEIAARSPECGIKPFDLRLCYDDPKAGLEDRWYQDLVGGIKEVPKHELPAGAAMGLDLKTFMINIAIYLPWLQSNLLRSHVTFIRRSYDHVDTLMDDFPHATAIFNCTGLGAKHLGGVEDQSVFPDRGQTLLVAEPKQPLQRMYVYSSPRWGTEFAHVFPRPLGGGVIIGGAHGANDWNGEPDMELAERIKARCCHLAPELGKPEDLEVISHNVGLRPSRKGGIRVELERRNAGILVHNYGAAGAGYQSSWGTAKYAVDLLKKEIGSTKAIL